MRNESNDLYVLPSPTENQKIPQYIQTIGVNFYHYYIVGDIESPAPYLDMINVLKTAEEHDTVYIYLNTGGGDLQTTIQIIAAMRQSSATVVTSLDGEVCSAGTLIFLAGAKHIVNDNCTFMIHNYSQWLGGKGNEVALRVKYAEQYFKKLANDLYAGFLTEEEIDSVIEGKDYWMDSEEVIDRLNRRLAESVSDVESIEDEMLEGVIEDNIGFIDSPKVKSKKKT